jgi:hypothetical protein
MPTKTLDDLGIDPEVWKAVMSSSKVQAVIPGRANGGDAR